MRRSRAPLALLLGAGLLAAAPARAAGPAAPVAAGFDANAFDPAARGSDWFALDSLDIRDDGRGAVGVVGEYAYKSLVVKDPGGSDRASVVEHSFVVHPGASLIILDRLRLSVDVPIVLHQAGTSANLDGVRLDAPDKTALGDSSFAADLRIFGRYGEVATGAVGVEAIAPTGDQDQYTGDGSTRLVGRLSLAGITKHVEWAARGGMLFRTQDEALANGQKRGEAIVFGASVGYRGDGGKLVVGPEIYGSTSVTEASAANTPVEALASLHYFFAPEWRVGVGVGPGIGSGIGAPLLRAALSIEFVKPPEPPAPPPVARAREWEGPRDGDKDGVPDSLDACPELPGPATDDPATNGCPPAADRDKDGVADSLDACPDDPGSPNADPDLNGCPPDADNDGVPDAEDACPLRAGVEQSDPKQTGCPPDGDKDGIPDGEDACPDMPGAVSKNPDDNGCPLDPDRDHDGVPNEQDACPNEPGLKSTDPQKNGCPIAILRGSEIRILQQVRFDAGSARLSHGKDADAVLGAIAKVMIDHPEITKVEVQGHTDNRGSPSANLRLSEERAKSVVKWLVSQGLAASRFTAVGFGDQQPIAPNTTDEGRKANRRVEIHVTEQAKKESKP